MADRNLTQYMRGGIFTTREGMELHVPPSGFDWRGVVGGIGVIDPYLETLAQQYPLGTKLVYGERIYKYMRMGAVAGVAGNLYQDVVPLAGHIDEVIGTHAIGATAIDFTPAVAVTDDLTADELQDGYFWPNDEAGEGGIYKIRSHPAITGAVLGVLTLIDPLAAAIVAAGTGTVLHAPGRSVIIHPSPPTAPIFGVAMRAFTAAYYGWAQTWGPGVGLVDGTVVIGESVVASDAVDGAVEPADQAITEAAPPTGHGERLLGYVMAVNATTEYAGIYWKISR